MPTLTGKLGKWELEHVNCWKDRTRTIAAGKSPVIRADSRIATMGSCFAEELARAMSVLNLRGQLHPSGLYYNTASVRQEIEFVFGGWPERANEPVWETKHGFVDHSRTIPRRSPRSTDGVVG